jgi:hypothetical protein
MMLERVLHVVARALILSRSPTEAHRLMRALGKLFPEWKTTDELRAAYDALLGRGTCLSRSLVLTACSVDSELVIGIDRGPETFAAHAWVELRGECVGSFDRSWREIARLRR